MRLPEYTPRLYRRLWMALVPFRLAGCAAALWTCWLHMQSVDRPLEPTGSAAGDVAFATISGLLAGVYIVLGLGLAVFIWWPIPTPERKR